MSLGSQISMQAPRVLGVQEFHDRAMPSILDSWDKAVLRYMLLADLFVCADNLVSSTAHVVDSG